LQTAAVGALARLREPEVPVLLIKGWRSYAPALQGAVIDALLSRTEWTLALLSAVEMNTVAAADLDAATRGRLVGNRNNEIRARSVKILAATPNESRAQVVAEFQN